MTDADSGGPQPPTEEEVAKLPRPAQVAFAARCARRVQPLFTHSYPDASNRTVESINELILISEVIASHDGPSGASAWPVAFALESDQLKRLHPAARAVCAAAESAYQTIRDDVDRTSAFNSAHAATTASMAAGYGRVQDSVLAAMRYDFELLRLATEREGWTDDTPVPPEFFGPMWPDGEPEGWPSNETSEEEHGTEALHLHFEIPDGVDKEEADRIIKEIILAANELHLAYGGSGLKLADRVKVYEPALVPAGGDR